MIPNPMIIKSVPTIKRVVVLPGTWYISNYYQDYIHPSELDPGEKYQIQDKHQRYLLRTGSRLLQGNGVYASAFV